MGQLSGKVAIITGGARGQGAAHARMFVEQGAQVVLGDVLHDEGKAVAAELGDEACYVGLDVTLEADWANAVATALDRYGRLDVLVNNAGISGLAPLAQMSLDFYLQVVHVNQVGAFLGMRAVLPAMSEAGHGSIINISSIEGLVGGPGCVAYSASKHAVVGMTKSAAIELAPLGIRVNSVNPGPVDTPMARLAEAAGIDVTQIVAAKSPMGRMGTVEEIARFVCFLASDESSYCTGSTFVVDGGWLAG